MKSPNLPNKANSEITVATWNLLSPGYALKYGESEGITNGKDNWSIRGPIIAQLIVESQIDVLFLQEISVMPSQLRTIGKFGSMMKIMKSTLEKIYHIVHYTHPARAARDGCAVLLLKSTFSLTNWYPHYVSFRSRKFMMEEENLDEKFREMDHNDVKYMVTAIAEATHIDTKRKFRFASAHWYNKKAKDPEESLLREFKNLANKDEDPVVIVWGGDLNTTNPHVPNFTLSKGGKSTRQGRIIDWILVNSEGGKFERENIVAQKFIAATKRKLKETAHTPSDHFADAVSVKF